MTRVLDTDVFSLYSQSDPVIFSKVVRHQSTVKISVITMEEVWNGWQALIHRSKNSSLIADAYARLTDSMVEIGQWPVMAFTETALDKYDDLKRLRLNVGADDLRIAAIALDAGARVVTRNVRDFSRVPGLTVETW